jgi:hypothetical protein
MHRDEDHFEPQVGLVMSRVAKVDAMILQRLYA